MRAVLGLVLFTAGICHTLLTWNVDGWTVLAGVGVWVMWTSRRRPTPACRPRYESDRDHMEVW